MYKHILIPTDGTRLAAKAVQAGIRLAKESRAKVTWFTALPEYELPSQAEIMNKRGVSIEAHEKTSRERAQRILAPLARKAKAAGVASATDYALCNRPAEAIAEAAKRHKCDLIVMASHGRTGISALVYGSETKKVISRTDIPTLVYR
jgi:nucleotide-binding universal stress UspA family protein